MATYEKNINGSLRWGNEFPGNYGLLDTDGSIQVGSGGYVYLYGDANTDGSLRIGATSTQRLTQKRVSGVWTTIESMDY